MFVFIQHKRIEGTNPNQTKPYRAPWPHLATLSLCTFGKCTPGYLFVHLGYRETISSLCLFVYIAFFNSPRRVKGKVEDITHFKKKIQVC